MLRCEANNALRWVNPVTTAQIRIRRDASRSDFAYSVPCWKQVGSEAHCLDHRALVVDDGAIVHGIHGIAHDRVGPSTRRLARERRIPIHDRNGLDVSAANRAFGAMRWKLALNARFISIRAACRIASVSGRDPHDTFDERVRTQLIMVRTTGALRANGTRACAA